jgi:hypothetical protein
VIVEDVDITKPTRRGGELLVVYHTSWAVPLYCNIILKKKKYIYIVLYYLKYIIMLVKFKSPWQFKLFQIIIKLLYSIQEKKKFYNKKFAINFLFLVLLFASVMVWTCNKKIKYGFTIVNYTQYRDYRILLTKNACIVNYMIIIIAFNEIKTRIIKKKNVWQWL